MRRTLWLLAAGAFAVVYVTLLIVNRAPLVGVWSGAAALGCLFWGLEGASRS